MRTVTKKDLEDLETTIKNLKSSLAYALSLGDKELFHSNVLAWFLEKAKTPQTVQAVAQLFLPRDAKNAQIETIEREVKLGKKVQLDLRIKYKMSDKKEVRFVVVENKFKSLPDLEQLDNYYNYIRQTNTGKVKVMNDANTTFILFAPQSALQVFKSRLPQVWKTVSYEDFLDALSHIKFSQSEPNAHFYNGFVDAYRNLLDSLLKIMKLTIESASEEGSSYMRDQDMFNILNEIRFHDVYEKLYVSAVFNRLEIKTDSNWKSEIFYNHGGGMKWSYIPDGTNVAYGVEVQQGRFMVFAETQGRSILTIRDEVLKKKFESLLKLCFGEESINHKKDGELNVYNKGIYKYQYARLSPETTISELKTKITTVMNAIQGSTLRSRTMVPRRGHTKKTVASAG